MGKSKEQIKQRNYGITIIFALLILLLCFTINNFIIIKKEKNRNSQLIVTYNQLRNNKLEKLEEQKKLSLTFDKIKNIDDEINSTKNDVFSLAKQVENKILNNETNYKIAYITFDDGPYYSTNKVLDILKQYKIKATFFTIGLDKDICYDNKNYSCANTYKKIVENGHTIANHTYSHAIFRGLYTNTDSFINEVKKQQNLIQDRTGVVTNILRFPGGSTTARALSRNIDGLINELRQNGYGWVDWSSQDGDGGYLPTYDVAWNNFTNSINENIEVVLFHDYSNITISMLPNAITYLENKDYILLPLFYDSIKINK